MPNAPEDVFKAAFGSDATRSAAKSSSNEDDIVIDQGENSGRIADSEVAREMAGDERFAHFEGAGDKQKKAAIEAADQTLENAIQKKAWQKVIEEVKSKEFTTDAEAKKALDKAFEDADRAGDEAVAAHRKRKQPAKASDVENETSSEQVIPEAPDGWTVLYHGTNLSKWETDPASQEEITVKGWDGLSVIDQEMKDKEVKQGGSDTTGTYSRETQPGVESFEIRVFFPGDPNYVKYRGTYDELDEASQRKVSRYYREARHPKIPNGERLIKIGQSKENGHTVLFYVPESLSERFLQETAATAATAEASSTEKEEGANPIINRLESDITKHKPLYERYKQQGNPNTEQYWKRTIQPDIDALNYLRNLPELSSLSKASEYLERRQEELLDHFPEGKAGIDYDADEARKIDEEIKIISYIKKIITRMEV